MSKLINLEECFFPELLDHIYQEVKKRETPLADIDPKYGDRLCRLMSKKVQYDFEDWIAYGGEALLVKAKERRGTRRTVAIKIASPHFNAPGEQIVWHGTTAKETNVQNRNTFNLRFTRGMLHQQEITDQISFSHGAIPAVYEISQKPLYFVMQFISGIGFDTWVMRADLQERIGIFAKILRFIGELHTHGIVHRDLKPNNIIVRQDKPHLIDLTTAKSIDDEENVTLFRMGIGCRLYAAPEVLVDIRQADWRSDIFACGKIMEYTYLQQAPSDGRKLPHPLFRVYLKATQFEKSRRYRFMSKFLEDYLDALKQLDVPESGELDVEELFKFFRYKNIAIPLFKAIRIISKGDKDQ